MPIQEPWPRIYREAPEVFEAFTAAEDPEGRVFDRLQELAGFGAGTVLEIGCGTGRTLRRWAGGPARVLGIEPESALLDRARRAVAGPGVKLLRGRGERLPLRDGSVDGVLATWVLAYLRPPVLQAVIAESLRVLKPGAGIWALENHWTGPFQALRGREGEAGEPGLQRLLRDHGFRIVEVVETELRFPSEAAAEHILGTLCGQAVRADLQARPQARLGHHVAILHRPGPPQLFLTPVLQTAEESCGRFPEDRPRTDPSGLV